MSKNMLKIALKSSKNYNNFLLLVFLNILHLLIHGFLENHIVLMMKTKKKHFAKCSKIHMSH